MWLWSVEGIDGRETHEARHLCGLCFGFHGLSGCDDTPLILRFLYFVFYAAERSVIMFGLN
jgi:hypothetical protein